ncbi:kinase-like domain-containing protein, partial [Rhizoctonia solani]
MQRPAFGARRFPTRRTPTADPYANPSTLFSHVLTLPTVTRAPNPPLETRLAALPPPPHAPQWTGSQPHSDSVPASPTNDGFSTSQMGGLAPGSSSTIHKTVLKRPAIATLHVDGTRVTNAADVARQFAAELRVLRTVAAAGAHPNIVGFVGAIDGLGIVLEWIDGSTLFERITLGRAAEDRLALISEQERLVWCDEVLSALCFVHSLGLTHGDVNTLNVLIVPSRALHGRAFGRAKLIDFGQRDSSPDSPTSPEDTAPTNAKTLPIPVPRRTRPKLPQRKTLPAPPPELTIPDGQLADAYSFGVLVLCV